MLTEKLKTIIGIYQPDSYHGIEDEVQRRVFFSNVVFLTLPAVYLVFMVIDYKSFTEIDSFYRFDVLVVPFTILLCFFCIWLNSLRRIFLSRFLFLSLWPFLLHVIPIWQLQTPNDYYLAFPVGIIFHSLLIQLMVSHRKEALWFWGFIGFNLVVLLGSPKILLYFSNPSEAPNPLANDPYYLLDSLLYWLLFNFVMYYVLLVVEHYIKEVNHAKFLIEEQKEELTLLNETLEKTVVQRTKTLENQNKQLINYAFYNAHMLRAPFCRIQGLVKLLDLSQSEGLAHHDPEIQERLGESVAEMEEVIAEMRKILHSEMSEPDDLDVKNLK